MSARNRNVRALRPPRTPDYPVRIRKNRRMQRLIGEKLVEMPHQLKRFEGPSSRRMDALELIAKMDHFGGDRLHGAVELLKEAMRWWCVEKLLPDGRIRT